MMGNGKNDENGSADIPPMIGIRTKEFEPLIRKWRADNPGVTWKWLLREALKKELAPYAGKRHAHLVEA